MGGSLRKSVHLPIFSSQETAAALNEIARHKQTNVGNNNSLFEKAIGVTYSGDYYRKSLKRSHVVESLFKNANFERVAGTGSSFIKSKFIDCNLGGANFQYCDFTGTSFVGIKEENLIQGSNFSESDFSDVVFQNSKIISCSFSRAFFENATIKNCVFRSTTFENAVFKNTYFENVELRNLNIDYVDFDNVKMKNVILPFSQVPYTFGGLTYLYSTKDSIWISSKINDEEKISVEEYKLAIIHMEKYYLSIEEYFPLTNIYLAQGKFDLAYLCIVNGLKQSIRLKDFRMLKFFSRLASRNNQFSNSKCKELYDLIHQLTTFNNISEVHKYELHIGEIRSLLLNNNSGKRTASIRLKTNIQYSEGQKLGVLIESLNEIVQFENPELKFDYLEVRHNSPYDIFLQLSHINAQTIFIVLAAIYSTFIGVNKMYHAFCDTIIKNHKVKKIKLEKVENQNIKKRLSQNKIHVNDIEHHISGIEFNSSNSRNISGLHYLIKD